jgi:methionyl-tRNA synthetase
VRETFYLTCAIDYMNARPHLGHAYEKITADCVARSRRLLGKDVRFVIGADEHGTKVEKAARVAGVTPQEYTDRLAAEFRRTFDRLHVSYDDYIRTTEPRHRDGVLEMLRRVRENGWITTATYTGWYCEGCEAYYTEKDLAHGKCPVHGTQPRWVEEDNFFFRLSAFREPLLQHYRAHPEFIRPETRRNEVMAFVESGLQDLSISRARTGVSWGIPFPDDPDHVVYVWFDALTNYVSALGFGRDGKDFRKWWPADVHFVGKDITRFHCVIWPAMLMAAELPLPRCVFGHGFIYQRGAKMSKSLGNIVDPLDVVEVTGADALRYFLLREISFGKDGDFTWEAFVGRYNADLANDLGNLVQRVTDMAAKFLHGRIPEGADAGTDRTGLRDAASDAVVAAVHAYERFDLSEAMTGIWALVRRANQVVQETAPWELAKEETRRDELAGVLSDILEAVRVVAALAEPAMPETAARILERIGLRGAAGTPWSASTVWRERPAWHVGRGDPLFPRVKPPAGTETAPEATADGKAKPVAAAHAGKRIPIDAFRDLELVVAAVRAAEPVPGADRLLKLTLDTGGEERQVIAGIAEHYAPEDLVGRQVVLVANLEPAVIRGVESQGMILAAKQGKKLVLLGPQGEIAPGAKIS